MSVELIIGGKRFGGWQSLSIERGIEQLSGAFTLGVTDKWNAPTGVVAAEIKEGQACAVTVAGSTVITGYIDKVNRSYDARSHGISVSGRDKAGDLVDCSAIYKTGAWANKKVEQIAADLCAPFGIAVHVGAPTGAALPAFSIQEGETVYEAIERAARMRALLVMSDGQGGIVLTRAGTARAPADLVQGQNILRADGEFNLADRYRDYIVKGQAQGDDHTHGAAVAHPSASIKDAGVPRYRPLIVLAEAQGGHATFAERALWERNVRAGRGVRATVVANGWTANARLWHPNTVTHLWSPLLGADHDLLIASTRFTLDGQSGELTTLELAPAEAYSTIADDAGTGVGTSRKKQQQQPGGELGNIKLDWDWGNIQ
jgi:prophage tail gpP-like protein